VRIAVNTRTLLPNKLGGIGWFTLETLERMTRNHPNDEFFFFFDRKYDEKYLFSDNITPIVVSPPARHPLLFWYWFEKALPPRLAKIQPDLFLSPDGYISLKTKVPTLAVIHDINFHHYPNDFPYLVRRYYNHFFPRFVAHAKRIATVSQFSKQDIHNTYHKELSKIDVVYNGINKLYKLNCKNVDKQNLTDKPYFLFVSSLSPRKNVEKLFEGFDLFKKRTSNEVQLIIVGDKMFWTTQMEETYSNMSFKDAVIFPDYVEPNELVALYRNALALTFVPYFEGFGIPIIEAMTCNIPVLTANASATKEVAGDAALLVDPFNEKQIAEGMYRLFNEPELRNELIEAGKKQAAKFSWDTTSDLLWNSVEKTVNQ